MITDARLNHFLLRISDTALSIGCPDRLGNGRWCRDNPFLSWGSLTLVPSVLWSPRKQKVVCYSEETRWANRKTMGLEGHLVCQDSPWHSDSWGPINGQLLYAHSLARSDGSFVRAEPANTGLALVLYTVKWFNYLTWAQRLSGPHCAGHCGKCVMV